MSVHSDRQNPPPIAGPLIAAMTGWCSRRMVRITSSSSSIERSAMVGRVSPSTWGMAPGSSRSAPEQKPWPAPVSTTTRGLVVPADLLERLAERDHHVEGHGVHSLWAVQGDERDDLGRGFSTVTKDTGCSLGARCGRQRRRERAGARSPGGLSARSGAWSPRTGGPASSSGTTIVGIDGAVFGAGQADRGADGHELHDAGRCSRAAPRAASPRRRPSASMAGPTCLHPVHRPLRAR